MRSRSARDISETGYVDGQNVTVEYHWLEGQYDRLPALLADLVRRQVAVIATPGSTTAALAAKAATATIPIVFGVREDPVKLGLVASLARPGGNATGINFFSRRWRPSGCGSCTTLVPTAVRVAVLVNPGDPTNRRDDIKRRGGAAPPSGCKYKSSMPAPPTRSMQPLQPLSASGPMPSSSVPTRSTPPGAAVGDLAARIRIPAAYAIRDYAAAGGLMSYGTDIADLFRQVGVYTGRILKGEKPADLPVLQSTKFEFVINLQTARALGIEVPPGLLSSADEVIE